MFAEDPIKERRGIAYVFSQIQFVRAITRVSLKEIFIPVFFTFLSNFMTLGAMWMIIMFARTLTDPETPIPGMWMTIMELFPEKVRQGRGTILMLFACTIIGFKMFASSMAYFAKLRTSQVAGVVKVRSSKIIFERILFKKLEFFDKQIAGDINNVLNRASATIPSFITLSQRSLLDSLMLITIIFFMVKISIVLTVACFVFQFITMIAMARFKIYLDAVSRQIQLEEQKLGASIGELLAHPELVKSNVAEIHEVKKYNRDLESTRKTQLKKMIRSELLPMLAETSEMFNIFFIAGLVALMRYTDVDSVELGSSFAFLYLVRTLTVRSGGIVKSFTDFIDNFKRLDELHELFSDSYNEDVGEDGKWPLDGIDRSIVFEDVSFSYGSRTLQMSSSSDDSGVVDQKEENLVQALSDVDLTIAQGVTTAVLGRSGSGKSTLAKILLKLYEPHQGSVRIGEQNISEIRKDSWRHYLSFVPQHSFVLPGTIRENILYGSLERDITEQELAHAVEVAHLGPFLSQCEDGLDTTIVSGALSGGEKQRIAIARAVLRKADLYIFDEATSAIDPHTEQLILQKLQEVLVGKTILFITHRSAAIQYASFCYYFEDGAARLVKNETFLDEETLQPYLVSRNS